MKEVFESYTAPELKKLIKAANITGYSKLKKDKLIELMLRPEHIDRFKGVQGKAKRVAAVGILDRGPSKKDMSAKAKALRELKKLSKPYQKKKEFVEDSKKIGERMAALRAKKKKSVPKKKKFKIRPKGTTAAAKKAAESK